MYVLTFYLSILPLSHKPILCTRCSDLSASNVDFRVVQPGNYRIKGKDVKVRAEARPSNLANAWP